MVSMNTPPEAKTVEAMCGVMSHRGPDARGTWVHGPAGLGHCRLSVIDLSEAANQPLHHENGRWHITYNGELYNYRELKAELEREGVAFSTEADSEVALKAYCRWGPACLSRFNGMFAFGVWDSEEKRLFLARDRMGEKPLFYAPLAGGGVAFASELGALLAGGGGSGRLSPAGVSQFLSFGYTLAPATLVSGVFKLPAASWMTVGPEGTRGPVRYWDLAEAFGNKARFSGLDEAAGALWELFSDAVRLRLVSHVPLGAFLSGGMDSSGVAAAMKHHQKRVQTFSMGFSQAGFSELPMAAYAASALETEHHAEVLDGQGAGGFDAMAALLDEPLADTSILPMFHLARFARNDVTVCLSGDGGDELFAGYETYAATRLCRATRRAPAPAKEALLALLDRVLPPGYTKVGWETKARAFLLHHDPDPLRAHAAWRTLFSEQEKKLLCLPGAWRKIGVENPVETALAHAGNVAEAHYLDRAMYLDMKTWLADDILVKVDRATMAHGLEARAPFLDYRLVEFAASLPVDYKMRGLAKKRVLKRAFAPVLPGRVIRQKKRGFNAPLAAWMQGSLAPLCQRALSPGGPLSAMFDVSFASGLLDGHLAGRRDNHQKLFPLVLLDSWCRRNNLSL
ncbi:MAG: asparagine synthase (glutamine-hydrolyzing) [Deltaproteobacteria bacterium]|nr:asparagine synthase (glutamine-hydrolyzing) [Deltaproteobacteria bacterium]